VISKKNVVAVFALGLCSLVWAPQVVEKVKGSPKPAPAPDTTEEDETDEPFAQATPQEDDPVEELIAAPAGAGPRQVLDGSESLLARMEAFAGGPAGLDLGELVRALDDRSRPQATATQAAVPATDVSGGSLPLAEQRADLADFAGTNELTGILAGADRSVALLGHRVVREGDLLWNGRIQIELISRAGVRLRAGEASLWMELPPFVAVGTTSEDAEDETSEGGAQ